MSRRDGNPRRPRPTRPAPSPTQPAAKSWYGNHGPTPPVTIAETTRASRAGQEAEARPDGVAGDEDEEEERAEAADAGDEHEPQPGGQRAQGREERQTARVEPAGTELDGPEADGRGQRDREGRSIARRSEPEERPEEQERADERGGEQGQAHRGIPSSVTGPPG